MAQIKLKLDEKCLCIERYLKEGYRMIDDVEDTNLSLFDAFRVALKISPTEGNQLQLKSDGLYAEGDPATCGLKLVVPQDHEGLLVGYLSEWNMDRTGHNNSRISCKGVVHKTFTAEWDNENEKFINIGGSFGDGENRIDQIRTDDSSDADVKTYDLLTSQPANWSTNYNDYFVMDIGGTYKSVEGDSAPTFEQNKYYELHVETQSSQITEPSTTTNDDSGFDPDAVTTNPPDKFFEPTEGVIRVMKRYPNEGTYVIGGQDAILYNVNLKPGSPLYDRNGDTFTPRKDKAPTPQTLRYKIQGHELVNGQWWVHQVDQRAPKANTGWWSKIDESLVPGLTPGSETKNEQPDGYRYMDTILPGDFIRVKVDDNNGDPLYDYYIILNLKDTGEINEFVKFMERIPNSVAMNNFVPDEEGGGEDPSPTPTPTPIMSKQQTIMMQYDDRIIDVVWIDDKDPDDGINISGYYYTIKLSKEKNNALHINEYGQLYCSPKISEDEGWSLFYPGNGIKPGEGGSYQPMEILRCNSTVSRIKSGDPLKDNEGINTNTLLLKKRETIMRTEV